MASVPDEPKSSVGVTTRDPQSPPSDNDGGERPVRKQLKETTIESTPSKENGRKRSFEESRDDLNDSPVNDDSRRKRSRECTPNNGQSSESTHGKDTGATTTSLNVSDNEHQPEYLLPATPKDLAKDDMIPEISPTVTGESLETQLDSSASYLGSVEHQDLASDSEWVTTDEESEDDVSSSGLDEPGKLDLRDSREHLMPTGGTKPSASQGAGQPMSFNYSDDPRELQIPAELSSPGSSDKSGSPESLASQEPYTSNVPKPPEELNMSAKSESYEDQPSPKDISRGSDGFEDHPTSTSDCSRDSYASCSPEEYNAYIGSPNIETASQSTQAWNSKNAANCLEHLNEHEDSTSIQEKPQENPQENPQEPTSHFSAHPDAGNENRINRDTSLQDSSNPATNESTKGLTKKRSREQLEQASPQKSETMTESAQDPDSTKNSSMKSVVEDEREKKRHRDNSEEREDKTNKLFSASAFANTAADSPFAKLAGAKSPLATEAAATTEKPASASAFAGSALGGFAGSEKSPFGTLGASSSSVFKSASPFSAAPAATGFGGIGGGFGSAAAGKTSFASPNVSSTFGETKAKPLGAEESDNDEDEGEGEEENNTFEAAKTDERFFEQTIETGEEEEKTVFACKAKLFSFSTGEWKERGIGTFKVNSRDVGGKKVGRMIMRADGALRVMLNSPVFEGMNYGDAKNNPPTNKQIFLASTEEGRTVPLLLRTPNESFALDLYNAIKKLLTGEGDESDEEDE